MSEMDLSGGKRGGGGRRRTSDVDADVALVVGLDVAEVADVALGVGGAAVVLAVGVEVRAGRGAAVRVVAVLVDVEAALRVGVEVLDLGWVRGRRQRIEWDEAALGVCKDRTRARQLVSRTRGASPWRAGPQPHSCSEQR